MNEHHIVFDLGERNIKAVLFKKLEEKWVAKECYIGKSHGIKEGNIYNAEKLKECIRRYVYEMETSARAHADEISFAFSLENIVKIEMYSKDVQVNGKVTPSHIWIESKMKSLNTIYKTYTLDNTFTTTNPIGLDCRNLTIREKVVDCSDPIFNFFLSIFEERPRTSIITFANALPTDYTICDIGYNTTRIRTQGDMIIINKGAKDLLVKLCELTSQTIDIMQKRVCVSYLTNEEMTIVDECRIFFKEIFDEIFKAIYLDLHHKPKMKLCGLGCYVPFLCDFLMEYSIERYEKKIDISVVKPEISAECNFNKNSLFFCNEVKKNLF